MNDRAKSLHGKLREARELVKRARTIASGTEALVADSVGLIQDLAAVELVLERWERTITKGRKR